MKYWFNGVPYISEVAPDEGGFGYWQDGLPVSAIAEIIVLAYLRPTGVDAAGGWKDNLGGMALDDALDEVVQDDADYIQSPFIIGGVTKGTGIWDISNVLYGTATFSNLTRTATPVPPSTGSCEVHSLGHRTVSGKYYAEVQFTTDYGDGLSEIGLMDIFGNIGISTTGQISQDGGSTIGSATAFGSGSTVCIAYDFGINKLWFRINAGSWYPAGGDPATGTGGYSSTSTFVNAFVYAYIDQVAVTLNTGANFTYGAPSGFSPWQSDGPATNERLTSINLGPTGSGIDGSKSVRVGYAIAGPDITLTVRLKQGTTLITEWSHSDLTETPQLFTQTLTTGERAAIDWGSQDTLKLEFEAN